MNYSKLILAKTNLNAYEKDKTFVFTFDTPAVKKDDRRSQLATKSVKLKKWTQRKMKFQNLLRRNA